MPVNSKSVRLRGSRCTLARPANEQNSLTLSFAIGERVDKSWGMTLSGFVELLRLFDNALSGVVGWKTGRHPICRVVASTLNLEKNGIWE